MDKLEKLKKETKEVKERLDKINAYKELKQIENLDKIKEKNKPKQIKQRKKQNIPFRETLEERFIRVAIIRLKRTLKDLVTLRRTIISKRYKMSIEQINTIHTLLVKEVDGIYSSYDSRNTQEIEEFKL